MMMISKWMKKILKISLSNMVTVNQLAVKMISIVKKDSVTKKEINKMLINFKVSLKKKNHKILTMSFNKKKPFMTNQTFKESLHHSWPSMKKQELLVSEQFKSLKTPHFIWQLIATHWWTGILLQLLKRNLVKRKFPSS
mgnify:CR=1 FL=1